LKSRFVKWLGAAYGVVLVTASAVAPAPAANINTNANECAWQFNGSIDDVVHTETGVSSATASRPVGCSILRSPLAAGATTGSFYVDGDALNGDSMLCFIASWDYTGAFLGSVSFEVSGRFDKLVTMPAAQLGYWAYVGLGCYLPANGNGTLRGVTSLQ
jgi:hypothetical protein